MFNKLTHKLKVSANKVSRAASHSVNSRRSHSELRDMIVELKSFPKACHRAAKYSDLAVLSVANFAGEYAAAPGELVDAFRGAHETLIASVDAVASKAVEIAAKLEGLLEKHKESEQAHKAAGSKKLDEAGKKAAEEAAERVDVELREKITSTMREVVKSYGEMAVELYTILGSAADKQLAMIESQYVAEEKEGLPYEPLWDEARPATGAKATKPAPPADGSKRKPFEDLASLSRPVDGDTRIKYAKQWNSIVKDLMKPIREGNSQWVVYAQLRTKFSQFFLAWCGSHDDHAGFTAAAERLVESEAKLNDQLLQQYQGDLEGTVQALEEHLAVVPVVGSAAGEPDQATPRKRPADTKKAIMIAARAAQTLANACKEETIAFGNTAVPTMP